MNVKIGNLLKKKEIGGIVITSGSGAGYGQGGIRDQNSGEESDLEN